MSDGELHPYMGLILVLMWDCLFCVNAVWNLQYLNEITFAFLTISILANNI
jgi:hypothetical protein